MIDDEEIDDFLEHHGVLGMKWGRRGSKSKTESPADRLSTINKKTNKMSGDKIYGGAGLVGYYQKRRQSQHPYAKAKGRLVLRGATEAAVLLGGGTLLMKALHASPSQIRGGQIALGMLAVAQIGGTRVSQIHDVSVYQKHTKLINEKRAIEKQTKMQKK